MVVILDEQENPQEKYQASLNVQQNIDILGAKYSRIIILAEVKDNIEAYMQNSTNNKLLVRFREIKVFKNEIRLRFMKKLMGKLVYV